MGLFSKPAPPPNGDNNAPEGWHLVSDELYRWWTGTSWQEAYRCDDGRIDVGRAIRQTFVYVPDGGSLNDWRAARRVLSQYPPSRVVSMATAPGALGGRATPVFVIEWE